MSYHVQVHYEAPRGKDGNEVAYFRYDVPAPATAIRFALRDFRYGYKQAAYKRIRCVVVSPAC